MIQRVSPLAAWTTRDVWTYAKEHAIPLLPLYEAGYTSIGCEPCTTPPLDPDNPRSGRWQGQKLECGIHIRRNKRSDKPQIPRTVVGIGNPDTCEFYFLFLVAPHQLRLRNDMAFMASSSAARSLNVLPGAAYRRA